MWHAFASVWQLQGWPRPSFKSRPNPPALRSGQPAVSTSSATGGRETKPKFTVDNAKNIRLLWKLKTDNKPMGMQSFREPLIVAGVNTAGGVKTLAILAGIFR